MNITSIILADTRDQASSTGYIIDRLSSFNLSSGAVHHLHSSAAWEQESLENSQVHSRLGHFDTKNRNYGVSAIELKGFQEQQLRVNNLVQHTSNLEEKGMPRPKRKATSNHGNLPQAAEDMSRHSSKRFKTSSRRHTRSDDATHQPIFSEKQCTNWFREYTTPDDPDTLGPDGMEKFCEDIGVEPENVLMLVIAYKMNAQRMGYFTHKEWLSGLTDLQCDSVVKLQQRMDYLRDQLNDQATFRKIYRYAYDFARDKDQRSMDTETARIMLQLLLGKHWSLLTQFSAFLKQSKYKVINKDQWSNIFEFSRTIHNDLSNYDLDGAWPVMLDEFVVWQRAQTLAEETAQMDTRCS